MTGSQFSRELKFQSAIVIAKRMLKQGIITKDEYVKIQKKFAHKYQPVIGVL